MEKRTAAEESSAANVLTDSQDLRKNYEAPRVLLKRSVAHAILATVPSATGPSGSMLTSSG